MRTTNSHTPWLVALVAVVGVVAGGRAAHAEPIVLAIDGGDIYVGLGARDGVAAGSVLELQHEVIARDPRSGETLRDRFALGTLAVAQAGDALCVAHADPALGKRVLPGDHVRLVSEAQTLVDPWAERVAASHGAPAQPPGPAPGQPEPDHAALARQAWEDTLGRPPEQRVGRWAALLAADPRTPYAPAIQQEMASLRAQISARDAALARAASSHGDDRDLRIARLAAQLAGPGQGPLIAAVIDHVAPGKPVELALLATTRIDHAFLYARARGDTGYQRSELRVDGDGYLRGTIAAALVHGAALEWYVEAAPVGAAQHPALGTDEAPNVIAVDPIVAEAPIARGRTHGDLLLDYVDFDGRRSAGFDHYTQAEADFGYRFLTPVYAVRLGFGSLSGIGGPKAVIDAAPTTCVDPSSGAYACHRIDFSYVYSEVELRLRKNVALLLRPQAGLLTTDDMASADASRCRGASDMGCRFETGFGGRVRLRLGEELGTNLVLGAAFTSGVGTLLEASYHWLPAPILPVQVSVQVTDQPVIEDFGVRLIGDVGLRKLGWLYPSARVSYQARDINHTGVSGGLALNFDW